jgi:hypothetical protein
VRSESSAAITRLLFTFGLLAILGVAYIYGARLNWPPIRSDGIGYHAYLPAIFIDHDLTFKTFKVRIHGLGPIPPYLGFSIDPETGNFLDKYPIGTAILQAPFFIVADGLLLLSGKPREELSSPYQIANIVSGIFYFLLGVYVLVKILSDYFETRIVVLTTWLVVFGTNVFHYATYDGSFSHIYSFALIAVYARLLLSYDAAPEFGRALGAGIVFGLIAITRPPNAILGLLGLAVWLHAVRLTASRYAMLRDGAGFLLGALGPLLPQLAYWRFATGHFLTYSYREEGFNWAEPEIINFLFSVQKGLFFWAPSLLIAVAGFLVLPRRLRVFGAFAFVCMLAHVYISASWYVWSFGGSFGSRPFTDMMPILALPMAAGLSLIATRASLLVARGGVIALIGLNLFLMSAYWLRFVPSDGVTAAQLRGVPERYYELLINGQYRPI